MMTHCFQSAFITPIDPATNSPIFLFAEVCVIQITYLLT